MMLTENYNVIDRQKTRVSQEEKKILRDYYLRD